MLTYDKSSYDRASVIVYPEQQWDGKLENRNSNNQTIVNLYELGNIVEDIHRKLLEKALAKPVALKTKEGIDLLRAYTFKVSKKECGQNSSESE
jgi:hypothetical protein